MHVCRKYSLISCALGLVMSELLCDLLIILLLLNAFVPATLLCPNSAFPRFIFIATATLLMDIYLGMAHGMAWHGMAWHGITPS